MEYEDRNERQMRNEAALKVESLTAREILLDMLEYRFGPMSYADQEKVVIYGARDRKAWVKSVANAKSLDEAMKNGRAAWWQGKTESCVERDALLDILEQMFGPLSETDRAKVVVDETQDLSAWARSTADAKSFDEVLENVRVPLWLCEVESGAVRGMLLKMLQRRFGPLSGEDQSKVAVRGTRDQEIWAKSVASAKSLGDALKNREAESWYEKERREIMDKMVRERWPETVRLIEFLAKRKWLTLLFGLRFGPLSDADRARTVEATAEDLDGWVDGVLDAKSLDELLWGARARGGADPQAHH